MPQMKLDVRVGWIEKFTVRGFVPPASPRSGLLLASLCACTIPNPNAVSADESESSDDTVDPLEDEGESSSTEQGQCEPGTLDCDCLDEGCEAGLSCVDGICEEPSCGNGVLEPPEECDEGEANANAAACKLDCSFNVCGDGYLGPDEQCDDQNANEQDGCRSNCLLTDSPTCGNGQVDPGEFCYEVFFEPVAPEAIVAVSAGDLDQDGDLDLIAAMGDGSALQIAVLRAPFEAGAAFEEAVSATAEPSLETIAPKDLAAGRFGADEALHLMVNYSDGLFSQVEEYRWEQGTLTPLASLSTTSWNLHYRALADFGPSQPQLALYSNDNTFALVLAQGVDPAYEFAIGAQDATTARRGAPHRDNIYVADPEGALRVFVRQGLELVELAELPAAPAEFVAAVDLDGDGLEGAALLNVPYCPPGPADLCDSTLVTFFVASADDEAPLLAQTDAAVPALPAATAVRAIEANGDELQDLLVISDAKGALQVLETDPELSGKWQRTLPLAAFGSLGQLLVADFNADGVDDIVLHDAEYQDLRVMLSNP